MDRQAWYAVRVRTNYESTTATFLRSTGHVIFHPTYRDQRRWSDRVKQLEVPLFSGYIFCHMDINRRLPVLQAPGAMDIVKFGKTFVPVPDEEINSVRTIVSSPLLAKPCPYLNIGERVRVEVGPLAGVEGILLERKNDTRLVLSVNLLQRSIAIEVNLEWVKPVNPSFANLLSDDITGKSTEVSVN
jgi:transcription antitermination factor NusG